MKAATEPDGRTGERQARAVANEVAGVLDQFVGIRSDEVERHRLVELLKRNEWNLARVARVLGVTRRTVYMRLKRYDIARQKVPKTVKGVLV